ncbi:MAG: hypothetical protein R3B45_10295 [Bdellovibrionota bacterium]
MFGIIELPVEYLLGNCNSPIDYHGSLVDLVKSIEANECQIIVKTSSGSAMFLAGFIDHYCITDSLGAVAGDDTIFIAPRSIKTIKKHLKNIQAFIENFN